ncbi:nuclear transport factor 2 family protein [Defluviimonas sp. WL0002]|uniref:Nuclear transport factor 2 family protein n=1 Tax=Albidovulum marisflavi TaxID=2984159 RepID=A0ABT2ZF35_9RHOB|nr:nuclear transport factor 2 family protein [Defluviimonas sp. WL0002]MCV2869732.1 nuclear transport factor 2 family protein [Defluviimonas sp. WL0002]
MDSQDRTEIEAVVRTYIDGMVHGDRKLLERAFHPKMNEIGHFQGELLWNDREEFIALCQEAASQDAPMIWKILSLSVAGDIASVHIEDEWAGSSFDDYLLLLRSEGRWQIVSKAFRVRS